MMVSELSRVQFRLKSCASFQNQKSVKKKFDLKSQLFQTKIALHSDPLPLYYTHFVIAPFSCSNTGFYSWYKCIFDPVVG